MTRTPWGVSQDTTTYADGIVFHSTAGHGGFKLDRKHNAKVPSYLRRAGGWYEEDCEWAIVALCFPEVFSAKEIASAHATAKNWFPTEYMRLTSFPIETSESYILRERAFQREHADSLVVLAAWGDWHASVPEGMVGVVARRGGRGGSDTTEHWFNVPAPDYAARGPFGFVVDPTKYQERGEIR